MRTERGQRELGELGRVLPVCRTDDDALALRIRIAVAVAARTQFNLLRLHARPSRTRSGQAAHCSHTRRCHVDFVQARCGHLCRRQLLVRFLHHIFAARPSPATNCRLIVKYDPLYSLLRRIYRRTICTPPSRVNFLYT